MKKSLFFIVLSLLLTSCELPFGLGHIDLPWENSESTSVNVPHIDYATDLKIDLDDTTRVRAYVSVHNYVDGDTTHFKLTSASSNCAIKDLLDVDQVIKARYLAIDTPESTGKVEEWGKTASYFTKGKLANADSIIIESEDTNWNLDNSGSRFLLWVWYRTSGTTDYRLLNLEIVQEGLSMVKNASSYFYGQTIQLAYTQAIKEKLRLNGTEHNDVNYYYGDIRNVTIKEVRNNPSEYEGTKVSFEGTITKISGQYAYIEDYDAEEEVYYAYTLYMGFSSFKPIAVGNRLIVVGTIGTYDPDENDGYPGTYQLTGLTYIEMKPNYPENIKYVRDEAGNKIVTTPVPNKITGEDITTRQDGVLSTFVYAENLTVDRVSVTTAETSKQKGALTITCIDEDGHTIQVRTVVLYKDAENLLTKDDVDGKNITVTGIMDYYMGSYQLKVYSMKDFIIND